MSAKLYTIKLRLDDKDAEDFRRAHSPVSQIEALTSLVKWFNRQDEVVQKAALGLLPESITPDIAKMLLERMAHDRPDAQTTSGRPPVPRLVARSAKKTRENQ